MKGSLFMKSKYAYESKDKNITPASWFMFLGICNDCRYTAEECSLLRKIENLFLESFLIHHLFKYEYFNFSHLSKS